MNELALFAGIGGGILGGKLLGWRTVAAIEIDDYCRRILIQRQDDGILHPFPIWDDVRTFDGKPWRGIVDVVSGGFPCQDIAVGSKTKTGIDGERSGLWREMVRIVRDVEPRWVLVENSAALLVRGMGRVLGDLAALRYHARWGVFSGGDVGARHKRERLFIIAYRNGIVGSERNWNQPKLGQLANVSEMHENHDCNCFRIWREMARAHSRVDNGFPYYVERVQSLGNAQIPAVVKLAWETMT